METLTEIAREIAFREDWNPTMDSRWRLHDAILKALGDAHPTPPPAALAPERDTEPYLPPDEPSTPDWGDLLAVLRAVNASAVSVGGAEFTVSREVIRAVEAILAKAEVATPDGYCRDEEQLCFLKRGTHVCDHCGSRDTRRLTDAERARLAAPPPARAEAHASSGVAVEGAYMNRTIADFQRACSVHIEDEQRRPAPDTALIALLCDAIRCSRELQTAARAEAPEGAIHANCHDYVCNGDRTKPRGAGGASCSCRGRDDAYQVADKLRAEVTRLAEALEQAQRPRPISLDALWDENGRQRESSPCEVDQGDSLVVWYDDIVDFKQKLEAERNAARAVALDLEAARQELRDELATARRLRDEAMAARDQQAGALGRLRDERLALRFEVERARQRIAGVIKGDGIGLAYEAEDILRAALAASAPEGEQP